MNKEAQADLRMDFRWRKLFLALWIMGIGMAIALVWHGYQGWVLHKSYPYNTFLFNPDIRGSDFVAGMAGQNPYRSQMGYYNYFPAAFAFSDLYSFLPRTTGLYLYLSMCFLGLWTLLSISLEKLIPSTLQRLAVAVIFMGSYPILLGLDRGNLELVVALLVAASLFFYQRKNFNLSVGLLIPALCFKFYPAVLLLLFVRRKLFHLAILGGASFFLINLGFMLGYPESLTETCHLLLQQFAGYNQRVNLDFNGIAAAGSGWNCFRLVVWVFYNIGDNWNWPMPPSAVIMALQGYSLLMASLGLYLAGHVLLVETTFARRAILLLIYLTGSAPGGSDYKLMHLEVALIILILIKERRPGDPWTTAALAFCLIPKKEVFLTFMGISDSIHADASIAIILNPLCMVVALIFLIRDAYQKETSRYARRRWIALTQPIRRLLARPA